MKCLGGSDEKMVEIYKGKDIDDDKISFLKYIASQRYCDDYFSNINSINDLAYSHGIRNVDDECLVIGTDWFLCYCELDSYVIILDWISKDNENKIKQSVEIMKLFKNIFSQNMDKIFVANMRHDTSYKIYLKMLQKGYFEEINSYCYFDEVDSFAKDHKLEQEFMKKFNNIENFLSSDITNNYYQYFKYIFHCIDFIITPNFIKKYYKNEEKPKERVLKK